MQGLVGTSHLAGAFQQSFGDGLELFASLRIREFLRRPGQARIVVGGRSERVGYQRHHVVDFADDARAHFIDAIGSLDVREISLVNLLEVGFSQLPVARQRLVDDGVERRVVSGRVDVPDFIIARNGALSERFDLAERYFGEGHRAFVEQLGHRSCPHSGCRRQLPAAMTKLSP